MEPQGIDTLTAQALGYHCRFLNWLKPFKINVLIDLTINPVKHLQLSVRSLSIQTIQTVGPM